MHRTRPRAAQLEGAVYIVTPVVSTATKPSKRDVNGGPYQRWGGSCARTVGILLGGGPPRRKSRAPGGMRTGRGFEECDEDIMRKPRIVTRVEFKLCPSEWK